MSLELQKQQNIAINGSASIAEVAGSNNVQTVTVPIGQGGESQSNIDTLNTNNVTTTENQTKRTVDELYNSISALCTQYGISLSEVKKMGLLSSVSGMNEEYLLNAEQSEINKIVEHIKQTISALKEDGIEVNATNVEKYARLYNIQTQNGWDSIESFRKANARTSEGLTARLNRMYGKDVTKLSTQEKAEILESYFSRYFNDEIKQKVKNASSPEEAEKIKESVRTKQITDYTKLLFNSSPEEYELFRDAIDYLAANKRYAGFDAILRSCDTDGQRTAIANSTTYEQIKGWETNADQFDDRMSKAESTQLSARAIEYKDEVHIAEYHEVATTDALEFYTEENTEKLKAIKAKIENGEELTEEEQALLAQDNHFKGDNAGQMVGVGNNQVIEPEAKKDFLTTINNDAYKIGEHAGGDFYREVMTEVADYVEKHPETLTMPKEEFVKLMDEVTDNNYSKVVNDIANGTKTELTPSTPKNETPSATQKDSTASKNIDLNVVDSRYTEQTISTTDALAQVQNSKAELYKKSEQADNNSSQDKETPLVTSGASMEAYFQAYSGEVAFKKVRDEFGTMAAIQFTLNKNLQNATAKLSAIKSFDRLNCSQQFNTVKGLYKGLSIALDNAKDNTLERLQNVTLRTFGATKEARKAAEESLS